LIRKGGFQAIPRSPFSFAAPGPAAQPAQPWPFRKSLQFFSDQFESFRMTQLLGDTTRTLSRFWVSICAVLGLTAILIWLVFKMGLAKPPTPLALTGAIFIICFFTAVLSVSFYLVNRENWRLKQCAYELHAINHIYRDALSRLFSPRMKGDSLTTEDILRIEREILTSVTTKIANIFWNLTGKKCTVTVKLLAKQSGEQFCFTWARSGHELYREVASVETYRVGTGENTGFDEALKFRDSAPSHFYSGDLLKDSRRSKYRNQRPGWENLYRGTIVVPIRHVLPQKKESDVLGFLCLDTLSRNRLNGTYHVQYLAAFADQMYNFVSIMRRKYSSHPGPLSTET
jgi:hypothetical protein